MRHPNPLPPALHSAALTRDRLETESIYSNRLYRTDITRISQGVHLRGRAGEFSLTEKAVALAEVLPECVLSHLSALRLHGLRPPYEAADDERVHVTQPALGTRRIRRPGVVGHRRELSAEDVVGLGGVRVTTPARTWFDLAERCSVKSLIRLGDELVRIPRERFEGRSDPYASLDDLAHVIERAGRVKGKTRAREALTMIRVGADSTMETDLRLAIVEAGLPEPDLQVPLDPISPVSPCSDAGYRQWRIALQYDGATHFEAAQRRRDQRRDAQFTAAGWIVLGFNADDARDDFRQAVRLIRSALRQRGAL